MGWARKSLTEKCHGDVIELSGIRFFFPLSLAFGASTWKLFLAAFCTVPSRIKKIVSRKIGKKAFSRFSDPRCALEIENLFRDSSSSIISCRGRKYSFAFRTQGKNVNKQENAHCEMFTRRTLSITRFSLPPPPPSPHTNCEESHATLKIISISNYA